MKNFNILKTLSIVAIFVLAIGCVDGPIGPAGLAGAKGDTGAAGTAGAKGDKGDTGAAGVNGTNGVDANTVCLTCHTDANMDAKDAEYRMSQHFKGTTVSRNTKYCARCHTNEGFKEIVGNGKFVVTNDMPNATRINCGTCHKHSGFDGADMNTQILTTTSPVSLNYNFKVTDFGKTNNLCVSCHQIRGTTSYVYSDTTLVVDVINKSYTQLPFFPLDNTKEATNVNYQVGQSFSVHDGNQSNLFAGINGYEYAGKTYTRTWKHSDAKCTTCHMNKFDATDKTGGHTLWVNEKDPACNTCHNGDLGAYVSTNQKIIDDLRIALGEALVAKKVFKKTVSSTGSVSYSAVQSHDFNGKMYTGVEDGNLYATTTGNNTVSATTGLVVYGNMVKYAIDETIDSKGVVTKLYSTRIGRQWKYGELGAAYNYGYINSELSKGSHNHAYAKQLLEESIAFLNSY